MRRRPAYIGVKMPIHVREWRPVSIYVPLWPGAAPYSLPNALLLLAVFIFMFYDLPIFVPMIIFVQWFDSRFHLLVVGIISDIMFVSDA